MIARLKPIKQHERRADARKSASDVAVIKTSAAGVSLSEILDTSASGLKVTSPLPIAVGSKVEIEVDDVKLTGWVRSCVRASTQFLIGIGDVRKCANGPDRLDKYNAAERDTDVMRAPASRF